MIREHIDGRKRVMGFEGVGFGVPGFNGVVIVAVRFCFEYRIKTN